MFLVSYDLVATVMGGGKGIVERGIVERGILPPFCHILRLLIEVVLYEGADILLIRLGFRVRQGSNLSMACVGPYTVPGLFHGPNSKV